MDQNFSSKLSIQKPSISATQSENILPAPQTSFPDHQLQAPRHQAAHKKKRSFLFTIVAVLVLLFLGGTGYVLAKQGYIELPLPFLEKETEEVLEKTIQTIKDIQSAHFISHIDASAALKNFGKIASPEMFGIGSNTDRGDVPEKKESEDGGKTALSLSLVAEGDWEIGANAGAGQSRFRGAFKWEGLTMEFDLEIKQIGDILYFKIYQMPPIPLLSLFTGGMELKGQWFKVNVKELAEKGGAFSAPQIEDISGKTKQKAIALLDVFADALILEKLKGERLDGVKMYHYGLSFDAEKLKGALTEARALQPELLSFTDVPKSEAQKMEQEWSRFLEEDYQRLVVPHLQALHTEVWIGKKDYFVRKIAMQYALPSVTESTGAAKDEMGVYDIFDTFTIGFDYQFSTINVPVAIDPPENSRDLMEEFQNGPFGDARRKARDAKRMADIRVVQSGLEIYNARQNVYPKEEVANWDSLLKLLGASGLIPPDESADYCYYVSEDKDSYIVSAVLEQGELDYVYEGVLKQDVDFSKNSFILVASSEEKINCIDPKGVPVVLPCSMSKQLCLWGGQKEKLLLEKAASPAAEEEAIPAQADAEDADSDKLPDALEALFGTDPANPDTDGDGYMDGVEVENEYNPLGEGKIDIDSYNAR